MDSKSVPWDCSWKDIDKINKEYFQIKILTTERSFEDNKLLEKSI